MISAFPLQWPEGYARTPAAARKWSRWKKTLAAARDYLQDEIRRMEATELVISTNQPLKQNGELRADFARFKEVDTGVAVYFDWKGRSYVMCCDVYRQTWENIYAIARTINALRQIDRDGVSEFLERAFTGFPGLPAPGESTVESCYAVLGISPGASKQDILTAYRYLAMRHHPDNPITGDAEIFMKYKSAYEEATSKATR
jgi:DnaJ-domain-containing protein 1